MNKEKVFIIEGNQAIYFGRPLTQGSFALLCPLRGAISKIEGKAFLVTGSI